MENEAGGRLWPTAMFDERIGSPGHHSVIAVVAAPGFFLPQMDADERRWKTKQGGRLWPTAMFDERIGSPGHHSVIAVVAAPVFFTADGRR